MSRIACVPLIALLSACTQLKTIPAVEHYPQTQQHKIQAAKHWDLVADHASKQLMISMAEANKLLTRPVIYIAPPEDTVFGEAFHGFLTSHLVSQGMTVTTNENNYTMRIDYDTQVVHHGGRGIQLVPGALTALGVGAWVVRGLLESSTAVAAVGTAAGTYAVSEAVDEYDSKLKPQPNTEIILDVYAIANDQYISHNSNIYYINDPDEDHYAAYDDGDDGFAEKLIKVVTE
ncbi:MAG: hypothetical protein MI673_01185 [Thiotrichales bacterium]|nr:hypothetical protein [Thiotrichales bacterium]